ncbi:serine/threonine-protein kinase [Pendulispora brunnea]|uniref:Serine/threonine-protein kinase n=1 Tax=Pendulispora brunnea TaxID=2905690 RepID=A0ABZ2JXV4_9BACT
MARDLGHPCILRAMPLRPGERFNRYRIGEVLGSGGMGVVYRAHDPRLHRYVALKLLQTDWVPAFGNTIARSVLVMREARAAASLDHPNAVSIFDVGEEDGQPFIAMELIVGRPLRAFVGDMTIPLQRRLRWLLDVARVLDAAHQRGLVHRDIKPENIMVRDDHAIKVLDFGIARQSALAGTEGPGAEHANTELALPAALKLPMAAKSIRSATVEGTPLYMAPEQMRGESPDGRSDQFAWGVVAHELLTGRMPWAWSGDLHALLADMEKETPRFSTPVPGLAPAIYDVIERALAAGKDRRFESMAPIVSALESLAVITPRVPEQLPTSAPVIGDLPPNTGERSLPLRKRAVARRFAILLGSMALAVPLVVALRTRVAEPVAQTATARVSPSETAPVRTPISANPEAVAAFEDGIRAYHDSSFETARLAFEHAVELDPRLAAAHLRLGIFYIWIFDRLTDARESLARANAARDTLDEHDRMLLHAIALYLEREPPDFEEMHRRLLAALERFPKDAELLLFQTLLYMESGRREELLRSTEEFVAATPPFAAASWNIRGLGLLYSGRDDEALAMFERCLNTASSTTCLGNIMELHSRRGECEKGEQNARRQITLTPNSPFGYEHLAGALAARGLAASAVIEALQQKWSRISAERRERERAADEAHVALWRGDFTAAITNAARLEHLVADDVEQKWHAEAARITVGALMETGKEADASKVSQRFLARKDGWMAPPWRQEQKHDDPTPQLLEAELRAGTLHRTDFEAARANWAKQWVDRAPPALRNYVWYYAYASLVSTESEAAHALAVGSTYEPLPAYHDMVEDAAPGRAYLLAGRIDDATKSLQAAARWCDVLYQPIVHTRAVALLGRALEIKGDTRGACAAYNQVLARWGAARPRSVTAEEVKVRARALACRSL